jgi:hypothetical protein
MRTQIPTQFQTPLYFALAVTLLAFAANATVPGRVNYQGLLLDNVGDPITGPVDMVFSLYSVSSGGSALWTEAHDAVDVLDGVYEVELGSTTALTPALLAGAAVYLEIEVETEILTPRQRLLAVPYALQAESSNSMGTLSALAASQIYDNFSFDGGDPPNNDPSEGTSDVDGDGLANFVDNDNDGDGITDTGELAQGTDINLITPNITGFNPDLARTDETTLVQIQGTGFESGLSVVFGSETPAPQNLTSTSVEVDIGPQVAGNPLVTVTNPNGEQNSSSAFEFFVYTPDITSINPTGVRSCTPTSVHIQGTSFDPGLSVAFGSQTPIPMNLTETDFDVDVGPQVLGLVDITVTNPNSAADTVIDGFDFFGVTPTITGFNPPLPALGTLATFQVQGANFDLGISVTVGSETPTPTNVTSTSFDVTALLPPTGQVVVTVTNICGEQHAAGYDVNVSRTAFVSSVTYDSNLGGIAGADAKCAQLASDAGLSGTFLAWLSDGVIDPDSRFVKSLGPYVVTVDDTVIADGWADLTDGTLDFPITYSEYGVVVGDSVFTNVDLDGTTKDTTNHCNSWTAGGTNGNHGRSISAGGQWTDYQTAACGTSERIYCFEQ